MVCILGFVEIRTCVESANLLIYIFIIIMLLHIKIHNIGMFTGVYAGFF